MFLLREALPDDLEQLRGLARVLNTLNLPDDSARLEKLLQVSRQSFDQVYRRPRFRDYLFVLEDAQKNQLIGSCLIIAQHGTHERPAVYFDMREEQKFSSTLDKYFIHPVLQLRFDYDGPTEIGGLILDKAYRSHPLKLGRALSFVRFLFIGLHRELFRSRIVAELLPPLNPDGTSELWDCLGKNFTELDYRKADLLSRDNVEFIRSLFPSTPIYTALLPAEVRNIIGVVGPKTQPAKRMLEKIGFSWDRSIDPFDGGPTYAVQTERCAPVIQTRREAYRGALSAREPAQGRALVCRETTEGRAPDGSLQPRFVATLCDYQLLDEGPESGLKLRLAGAEDKDLGALKAFRALKLGDELGFLPL